MSKLSVSGNSVMYKGLCCLLLLCILKEACLHVVGTSRGKSV
jgi:hypothetical protein